MRFSTRSAAGAVPYHSLRVPVPNGLVPAALALLLAASACSSDENGTENATNGTTGVAGAGTASTATPSTDSSGSTTGSNTTGASTSSPMTTNGTSGGTSTTGEAVPGDFTVNLTLSDAIQTVGIVEFSSPSPIDEARVDFGREAGNYEFSAPVDLSAPNYRTLLLGMKENTTYYVQVFAQSGGTTLSSEVLTLDTLSLPNATPSITVNNVDPGALYGGFTINCTGVGGFGGNQGSGVAFVIDKDGDPVWAYDLAGTEVSGCSRARMSFDGKDMWIGNFSNVSPDGALMRLSMDGQTSRVYSIPGRHHDFAVLPNNNILYQAQANGGMGRGGADEGNDLINELDVETGESRLLYDENTDFSEQISESGAHTNYIEYVPHLNGISFSMRHTSTIAVISYPAVGEQAQLLMVFGGPLSDFDFSWTIQHGHELLENSLLIFNNEAEGGFGSSAALEYQYDLSSGTGELVMNYAPEGRSSGAFGDVQRLPNGNTLVTYSTQGVIHEIDANATLLREMSTDPLGYSQHRKTLYGPPPTFAQQ